MRLDRTVTKDARVTIGIGDLVVAAQAIVRAGGACLRALSWWIISMGVLKVEHGAHCVPGLSFCLGTTIALRTRTN